MWNRLVLVVTYCGWASAAHAEDTLKPLRWSLLAAAHTADAVSTEIALSRIDTRERNPLLVTSTPLRLSTKLGLAVSQGLLLDRLARNHPRAALTITILTTVGYGYIAVYNTRQGARRERR